MSKTAHPARQRVLPARLRSLEVELEINGDTNSPDERSRRKRSKSGDAQESAAVVVNASLWCNAVHFAPAASDPSAAEESPHVPMSPHMPMSPTGLSPTGSEACFHDLLHRLGASEDEIHGGTRTRANLSASAASSSINHEELVAMLGPPGASSTVNAAGARSAGNTSSTGTPGTSRTSPVDPELGKANLPAQIACAPAGVARPSPAPAVEASSLLGNMHASPPKLEGLALEPAALSTAPPPLMACAPPPLMACAPPPLMASAPSPLMASAAPPMIATAIRGLALGLGGDAGSAANAAAAKAANAANAASAARSDRSDRPANATAVAPTMAPTPWSAGLCAGAAGALAMAPAPAPARYPWSGIAPSTAPPPPPYSAVMGTYLQPPPAMRDPSPQLVHEIVASPTGLTPSRHHRRAHSEPWAPAFARPPATPSAAPPAAPAPAPAPLADASPSGAHHRRTHSEPWAVSFVPPLSSHGVTPPPAAAHQLAQQYQQYLLHHRAQQQQLEQEQQQPQQALPPPPLPPERPPSSTPLESSYPWSLHAQPPPPGVHPLSQFHATGGGGSSAAALGGSYHHSLSGGGALHIQALSSENAAIGGGSGRNLAERLSWSVEDDAKIVQSVREHGYKWRLIASFFEGRSDDAVRNRWNRVKDLPVHNDGRAAPPKAPKSVAKAAAERSHHPNLDEDGEDRRERVSWSLQEDEMILRSVGEIGHKWHKIAQRLSGRTEHAIRNRFARLQSLANRGKPIILSSGLGQPIGIQLVPQPGQQLEPRTEHDPLGLGS